MDLIYLVVGVGLGLAVSRIIGSLNKPQASIASLPQPGSQSLVDSKPELKLNPTAEVLEEPLVQELKPIPVPTTKHEEPLTQELKPTPVPTTKQDQEPLMEELKQTQLAYEMAKQISQFKSGFLARASHELRSPLSSLIGMHQLILSELCDSPEEEREFVAQANISALKMVKLLTDVIDVSKIEHGKARLEITPLALSKIFENLHTLTYMQAAHSNLPFKVIAPEPEIYVLADSRRFQQVLVGIVDIAITRMESGTIQVSAASAPESNQALIWIDLDSPNQVWSEEVDLLANKLETTTDRVKASEMSPGLNLLLVQTLVEVMQGRLELVAVSDGASAGEAATRENITRLQCSLPLATPESVEQASA